MSAHRQALLIGVVGFQNRDEFETFQKARSWAVLFVPPCFEASQNGSKARDFGSHTCYNLSACDKAAYCCKVIFSPLISADKPRFSSADTVFSRGMPMRMESAFESVFLRSSNAAVMSENINFSFSTLTGGSESGIKLITDEVTFGAGIKLVGGTEKCFSVCARYCTESVSAPVSAHGFVAQKRSATSF